MKYLYSVFNLDETDERRHDSEVPKSNQDKLKLVNLFQSTGKLVASCRLLCTGVRKLGLAEL